MLIAQISRKVLTFREVFGIMILHLSEQGKCKKFLEEIIMKKLLVLALAALVAVAALASCSSEKPAGGDAPASASSTLRFVTGGESGTYYAFGTVIAQHATNNIGTKVTALVGAGSKGNVNKLADGEAGKLREPAGRGPAGRGPAGQAMNGVYSRGDAAATSREAAVPDTPGRQS